MSEGAKATAVKLLPRGDGPAPLVFRGGAHPPYAIRWYGVTSLFGHFRNFIASAIASESVDSRDWMRPEPPADLLRSLVGVLGGDASAPTLAEALGRPLWLDFVADTGDDRDVSLGVGRMLAPPYLVDENGAERLLPRGEVLLFGGDTAYPVATADEIQRRLVGPWNEALRESVHPGVEAPSSRSHRRVDSQRRVLIGIPGNHDWYDGLDGFGRLFRKNPQRDRSFDSAASDGASPAPSPERGPHHGEGPPILGKLRKLRRRGGRNVGLVARQLHLDEVGGLLGMIANAWRLVRAIFKGVGVKRQKRLVLVGYEAVQESSYWILPLTRGLDVWGVDRQLGQLDFRQRQYFQQHRRKTPDHGIVFVAPDPAIAFGEEHDPGARMLKNCKLSMQRDTIFYLTGDMHHYERRPLGQSLHVIAGGGGAFLHGTRISPSPSGPAACAYPTAAMTRQLVAQVPLKLMMGRAGLLVHLALALIASIELASALRSTMALVTSAVVVTLGLSVAFYMIAGHRRAHPRQIAAASVPFAAALGLSPMLLKIALPGMVSEWWGDTAVLVVHAMLGTFVFGLFLATVAVAGLEQQQAFAALGHSGFKHFVRMCVHPGGKIEAWVIGKDDPIVPGPAKLIDTFTWSAHPEQAT